MALVLIEPPLAQRRDLPIAHSVMNERGFDPAPYSAPPTNELFNTIRPFRLFSGVAHNFESGRQLAEIYHRRDAEHHGVRGWHTGWDLLSSCHRRTMC